MEILLRWFRSKQTQDFHQLSKEILLKNCTYRFLDVKKPKFIIYE